MVGLCSVAGSVWPWEGPPALQGSHPEHGKAWHLPIAKTWPLFVCHGVRGVPQCSRRLGLVVTVLGWAGILVSSQKNKTQPLSLRPHPGRGLYEVQRKDTVKV